MSVANLCKALQLDDGEEDALGQCVPPFLSLPRYKPAEMKALQSVHFVQQHEHCCSDISDSTNVLQCKNVNMTGVEIRSNKSK